MRIDQALALSKQGPVRVRGFLILEPGHPPLLCSELLESMPPQCGQPSLVLHGVDISATEGLMEADGFLWSDNPVEVTGIIANGILTVSPPGATGP